MPKGVVQAVASALDRRYFQVKLLRTLIARDANDSGYFIAIRRALGDAGLLDALGQLVRDNVWDGDLISKMDRDDLIDLGLAERCQEEGYQTATSLGRNVYLED